MPRKPGKAKRWQFGLRGLVILAAVLPILSGAFAGTFGRTVQLTTFLLLGICVQMFVCVIFVGIVAGFTAFVGLLIGHLLRAGRAKK